MLLPFDWFQCSSYFMVLQEKIKSKSVTWLVGILLLGIPFMMGFQNYNVHMIEVIDIQRMIILILC